MGLKEEQMTEEDAMSVQQRTQSGFVGDSGLGHPVQSRFCKWWNKQRSCQRCAGIIAHVHACQHS